MEQLDATAVAVFVKFIKGRNSARYVEHHRIGESWENTIDRLYHVVSRDMKNPDFTASDFLGTCAKEKGFSSYVDGFLSQQDFDNEQCDCDCGGLGVETLRIHMLDEGD